MPKMTAKYSSALDIVRFKGLKIAQNGNQEELYQALQKVGFFWDSNIKRWEEHDIEQAEEPTKLLMVRVWADAEIVEDMADDLVRISKKWFELVEKSPVYPCRPPKQREGRVYLKFLPKQR